MRVRRRQQQRAAGLRLADRERDDGGDGAVDAHAGDGMKITHPSCRTCRSEEHTSELQSLMRISYAVFCLTKKNHTKHIYTSTTNQRITSDTQNIEHSKTRVMQPDRDQTAN